MGYYSNFHVQMKAIKDFSITEILTELSEIIKIDVSKLVEDSDTEFIKNEKEGGLYYIPITGQDMSNYFNFSIYDMKLYYFVEQCTELSKKFPDLKIFITRQGESIFDYEETLIVNGEVTQKTIEAIFPKWNDEDEVTFEENRPQF